LLGVRAGSLAKAGQAVAARKVHKVPPPVVAAAPDGDELPFGVAAGLPAG